MSPELEFVFSYFKNNFIYLCLAGLGLHCFAGFSLSVASGGYSLAVMHTLLTVVASLIVGTGSWARGLSTGSIVAVLGLSCSAGSG